jgi:hypothetical protein
MTQHYQDNKRKEIMGVQQGEHFASRELKLQPIQLDRDKGRPQGFDAVYTKPNSGNLVVVDFKGGAQSKLSSNQKKATYMTRVADRTLASQKATPREKEAAKMVKDDLEKGKRVEFLAVKTPSLGKTHVSHHSIAVKPANSQAVHRFKLDHARVSSFSRANLNGWQQPPSRTISRPTNDNKPVQPKSPSPSPQQSPKRSR